MTTLQVTTSVSPIEWDGKQLKLIDQRLLPEKKIYIEVRAPIISWTFPSGPPCYMFDSKGNLVDWTMDIGDDGRYQRKWGQVNRDGTTIEKIRKEILIDGCAVAKHYRMDCAIGPCHVGWVDVFDGVHRKKVPKYGKCKSTLVVSSAALQEQLLAIEGDVSIVAAFGLRNNITAKGGLSPSAAERIRHRLNQFIQAKGLDGSVLEVTVTDFVLF